MQLAVPERQNSSWLGRLRSMQGERGYGNRELTGCIVTSMWEAEREVTGSGCRL